MLPGMEILACPNLAVSPEVMQHVVQVESGANPFAIGVVDGQLVRQPRNMDEALATAHMLESQGYNFSVGIAQVNRANLQRYGLDSYRKAFNTCDNLAAGARILASCYGNARGDWGKAFSCYYSGNFVTGFRDGYVQKVYASINRATDQSGAALNASTPGEQDASPLQQGPPQAAGTTALRPMVVYSSNSASYRTALRSAAAAVPGAATAPWVVSAAVNSARAATLMAPALPSSRAASHVASEGAAPFTQDSGAQLPLLPAARPGFPATTGASPDLDDGAFQPRVLGPERPSAPSTETVPRLAKPIADGADLRLEQGDGAFVF